MTMPFQLDSQEVLPSAAVCAQQNVAVHVILRLPCPASVLSLTVYVVVGFGCAAVSRFEEARNFGANVAHSGQCKKNIATICCSDNGRGRESIDFRCLPQ